jgi:ABC-type dipeptide/oligopeptide/nickel transport system permease component
LEVADKTTWAGLGQNSVMQAGWEKLGYTPETAAPLITSRFDYSFDLLALGITAAVVIGYFLLVVAFSKSEYREVIAERFGRKDR